MTFGLISNEENTDAHTDRHRTSILEVGGNEMKKYHGDFPD